MDTTSIRTDSPESGATPEPSHGCYEGLVFLTYEEDGHEWTEAVPCRRCAEATAKGVNGRPLDETKTVNSRPR